MSTTIETFRVGDIVENQVGSNPNNYPIAMVVAIDPKHGLKLREGGPADGCWFAPAENCQRLITRNEKLMALWPTLVPFAYPDRRTYLATLLTLVVK